MSRPGAAPIATLLVSFLVPLAVGAQATDQPSHTDPATPAETSRFWFVLGGAYTALRADCDAPANPEASETCEESFPYRQTGSMLADIGYRLNNRTDIGVEVIWVPTNTAAGRAHITHIDAIAQFRPTGRIGLQLFGAQHVGAVGDLRTADAEVDNVVGNFWSLGAAIVLR